MLSNIPNLLTGLRLGLVPVLVYLAWKDMSGAYLACLAFSLATDFLDGLLARALSQSSEFGARLDSWADTATYLSIPWCAWRLWPELVRHEALFFAVALVFYLSAMLIGFLRYRRLTSYHTWASKLSAVLLGIGVLLLFGWKSNELFRPAVLLAALSYVEEIAITTISSRWQANVPTIWHALKQRSNSGNRPPGS